MFLPPKAQKKFKLNAITDYFKKIKFDKIVCFYTQYSIITAKYKRLPAWASSKRSFSANQFAYGT